MERVKRNKGDLTWEGALKAMEGNEMDTEKAYWAVQRDKLHPLYDFMLSKLNKMKQEDMEETMELLKRKDLDEAVREGRDGGRRERRREGRREEREGGREGGRGEEKENEGDDGREGREGRREGRGEGEGKEEGREGREGERGREEGRRNVSMHSKSSTSLQVQLRMLMAEYGFETTEKAKLVLELMEEIKTEDQVQSYPFYFYIDTAKQYDTVDEALEHLQRECPICFDSFIIQEVCVCTCVHFCNGCVERLESSNTPK